IVPGLTRRASCNAFGRDVVVRPGTASRLRPGAHGRAGDQARLSATRSGRRISSIDERGRTAGAREAHRGGSRRLRGAGARRAFDRAGVDPAWNRLAACGPAGLRGVGRIVVFGSTGRAGARFHRRELARGFDAIGRREQGYLGAAVRQRIGRAREYLASCDRPASQLGRVTQQNGRQSVLAGPLLGTCRSRRAPGALASARPVQRTGFRKLGVTRYHRSSDGGTGPRACGAGVDALGRATLAGATALIGNGLRSGANKRHRMEPEADAARDVAFEREIVAGYVARVTAA